MDQLIGQFSRPHYTVLQCVSSISRAPENRQRNARKADAVACKGAKP
jgi:hypothetical protein